MDTIGFLGVPEPSAEAQQLFDEDIEELGYVMNVSRLWAYQPAALVGLSALLRQVSTADQLSLRQRAVLVTACASARGDSYCSLAWGQRLADASDARTAAGVVEGDDGGLTPGERAMAGWARKVARDPNGTTDADVRELRDAGFTDSQIFTMTAFVALRVAFSTVNDALGLRPDAALRAAVPAPLRAAVTFGRPAEEEQPPRTG
ncbi:carboxymuconolactone decarboxylase family protein [Rhizomonospora bruguierae]|uniref:carboxymuconolactone decarboxylase family protein n=1 Tax=Rhizomonospora bruguierae TaxID=1581705 RepID=UPI001BCCCAA5|nr:hypothetical protein [Micromonospora sp. NBRC 107566]